MNEVTFTFRVDDALKTEFSKLAKEQDRTPASFCVIICAPSSSKKTKRQNMTHGFGNRHKSVLMKLMQERRFLPRK